MHIAEIGRYPVKSMLGESPGSATLTETGLVGDRAWALVDTETGKVASAKMPRLWQSLLGFRASYDADPGGAVTITMPDGGTVRSGDGGADEKLSRAVGRPVRLEGQVPEGAVYDEEWPDVDGVAPQEFIASTRAGTSPGGLDVSALPVGMLAPGTFQDVAPVTLMTTSSLAAARALHPDGDWSPRRFRSTLLIDDAGDGFAEQDWVGRTLTIGEVQLSVMAPTPRCVMVTLAQQDLPPDPTVLRTLAKHNRVDVGGTGVFACLGAYAAVTRTGTVRVGDEVTLS
jgi:uncharacterized protein YcbX